MDDETYEDNQFLNMVDQGYIGLTKPQVEWRQVSIDWTAWQRQKAANELGLPIDQIADEPDDSSRMDAWA